MKKAGTILLFCIIVQYTFGLFTIYLWTGHTIRQSIKEAITAGNFQPEKVLRIAVSNHHLSNQEKDFWQQDEISIYGKMYDVISVGHTVDSLIINCLSDDDETGLANAFLHAMNSNHGSLPGSKITDLSTLFFPFVLTDVFILQSRAEAVSILHNPVPPFHFSSSNALGVLTPPPRQV